MGVQVNTGNSVAVSADIGDFPIQDAQRADLRLKSKELTYFISQPFPAGVLGHLPELFEDLEYFPLSCHYPQPILTELGVPNVWGQEFEVRDVVDVEDFHWRLILTEHRQSENI